MRFALSVRRLFGFSTFMLAAGSLLSAASCGTDAAGPAEDDGIDKQSASVTDNTFGTWVAAASAPGHFLATHATLLRNNKLLMVGGSSFNCCFQSVSGSPLIKEEAYLYDPPPANSWGAKLASPAPFGADKDAFCTGHAHDGSGGVIFQGGLLGYGQLNGHGIDNAAKYDPAAGASGTFAPLGAAEPNWYPTLVAGPLYTYVFPGNDADGTNHIRKLKEGATTWTTTGKEHWTHDTYPRVHLLPNGNFFISSPSALNNRSYLYDPVANTVPTAIAGAGGVVPNADGLNIYNGWKATAAVLPLVPQSGEYPNPKVGIFGGAIPYSIDLGASQPGWAQAGTRDISHVRVHANSTLLPTGQVLITGGVSGGWDSTAVKNAEVYDPATNSWLITNSAVHPRNYHSIAILLPDGRVFTAAASQDQAGSDCGVNSICDGSGNWNPDNTIEASEIFQPWYHTESGRPTITSCPALLPSDGSTFSVGIGASLGTTPKMALMRAGSVTHAFDVDQRHLWLDIVSHNATSVTVKAPYGAAAAPPGDYMLFALKDRGTGAGVPAHKRYQPSAACWVKVQPQVVQYAVPAADYPAVSTYIKNYGGYRVSQIDGYEVGAASFVNVVFSKNPALTYDRANMTVAEYEAELAAHTPAQGWRIIHVDSYKISGATRYAAVWDKTTGPVQSEWHGKTAAETTQLYFNAVAN
ncbi:MAG TPA: galactose oxidase-like domain-containing protein, partial [Polyangiaceae bacterium]|nr:galactose oxidase-like domain-containing protein [Polyangiaceae bacterium]